MYDVYTDRYFYINEKLFVRNQSLSICDGDGGPPVDDEPSSDGMIKSDGFCSSNESSLYSFVDESNDGFAERSDALELVRLRVAE